MARRLEIRSQHEEGNLLLYNHLRTRGQYEDWIAHLDGVSNLPEVVIARRPLPELENKKQLGERLEHGSRIARQCEHQNVVHCLGAFTAEGDTVQLFEADESVDLAAMIGASRALHTPLEIPLALWIIRQALEAVAHAHSLGIVHHALAPSEIFATRNGVAIDFGLVVEADATSSESTTQYIDLSYAAPEEAAGRADSRSDLYSLGAILWEMLTNVSYLEARGDAPEYVKAASLRADVPSALDHCLALALRDDPAARYPDARTMGATMTRLFYADLSADDEKDGRTSLFRWVDRLQPEAFDEVSVIVTPSAPQPMVQLQGTFTEMLIAREGPVHPCAFTTDDVLLEPGADGSWAPGMELRNQMEESIDRGLQNQHSNVDTAPSDPPDLGLEKTTQPPPLFWGLAVLILIFVILATIQLYF